MTARDVIVYTTPLCAPCERLKAFLRARGVDFTVKDLLMDETAAELIEASAIRSSPVLGVEGRLYAGPDLAPDRLATLLGL